MTSAIGVLAENNFGDTRSGGLAGPMGLFIILLLAVATVLLIRNMSARIRRLPAQFPDQASTGDHPDHEVAGSQAAESHEPERAAEDRQARPGT